MNKSPDAFRTISEVSQWLDTPAHVLRFWESKFVQIKPVKRAGGRRYYRPEDMALLAGIKMLLHEQGMTIKGVQKLLREKGVRHVAGLGPDGAGSESSDAPVAKSPSANIAQSDIDAPGDPVGAPAMSAPISAPAPASSPSASPPMHAARPAHLPPISMPPTAMPPAASAARMPDPAADRTATRIVAPPPVAPQSALRPLPAIPEDRPAPRGFLTRIARAHPQTIAARRARIVPVLDRLAVLRDRMAQDQA